MNKKSYLFIAAIAFMATAFVSCTKPDPQPAPDDEQQQEQPQQQLKALTPTVEVTDNWVWAGKPSISLVIENPNAVDVTETGKTEISTDLKKFVTKG